MTWTRAANRALARTLFDLASGLFDLCVRFDDTPDHDIGVHPHVVLLQKKGEGEHQPQIAAMAAPPEIEPARLSQYRQVFAFVDDDQVAAPSLNRRQQFGVLDGILRA